MKSCANENTSELIEALRPFAQQADSMWNHDDRVRVCGVEVRYFRLAAKLVRQHELREKGHADA